MRLRRHKVYSAGRTHKKKRFTLKDYVLTFVLLAAGLVGIGATADNTHTSSNSNTTTSNSAPPVANLNTEATQTPSTIDTEKLFSQYESTYDTDSGSYSFDYGELNSYFSGSNFGSLGYGTSTYRNGSETWTINCSEYTNGCTAYSSNGDSASSYCSRYTNSCSTYGSDGSSANTYCSNYTSSCSSYGSDGSYSNTYCSQYTNSCSTYGSDGSYSNTYCSSYTNSCSSYGSGGSSSYYDW
jgi:hypothetical protein